jgi:hypothetical protein
LVAEESMASLRGDVSNAFQTGLEEVLDVGPVLGMVMRRCYQL